MGKPTGFLEYARQGNHCQPPLERVAYWNEFHPRLGREERQRQGARCMACGVPWDGKEQIFRDVEVPLKCILEVRRSPENYIRRLSADQARQLAAQQSFVPMWDADAAAMAMANIRRLIQSVPVYRVFCGPDAADARAVHDILIHHPEQIREEEKDMRIKDGFVLRNVIDEYVVMPTGDNIAKFAGTVVLFIPFWAM